jgi:integrase
MSIRFDPVDATPVTRQHWGMASVRERSRLDGSRYWSVLWREGGRQTSQSFTDPDIARRFRLYLEADGPAAAFAALSAPADAPDIPILDAWAERHIDHLTGITAGTREEYRRLYARTWRPIIGHLPLDLLTYDRVATAINELSTAPRGNGKRMAAKSVANAHALLSAMLNDAVRDGHLATNTSKGVRLGRDDDEAEETVFLTREEFATLHAATPAYWQPLLLTLAGTGMRWGEATALSVRAVDVVNATVSVHRAWKRVPGVGFELGPTKTKRSRRTIKLPEGVVDVLRPLVAGRAGDDFLFVTETGRPVRHANFRARIWVDACARANLPRRPRIHDLRHTHASWLIAAGVPLPVIQRRLGHEDISTTSNVYGHLMPDLQIQAASAAQLALSGTL